MSKLRIVDLVSLHRRLFKLPIQLDVNMMVIHSGEFKGGKQLQDFVTEIGIADAVDRFPTMS